MADLGAYSQAVLANLNNPAAGPDAHEQAVLAQAARDHEDKIAAEKALAAIPVQTAPTYVSGGGAPPAAPQPTPGRATWGDIASDPLSAVPEAGPAREPTSFVRDAPPAAAAPHGPSIIPARVVSSPGGEIPIVGPGQRAAMGLSDAINARGAEQLREMRAVRLEQEAAAAAEEEKNAQARMAGAAVTRQQFADKADALAGQMKSEIAALSKMHEDPERWKNSRTTGQKVQNLIAVALSGLGSYGGTRGRNQALDLINAEIERDVQSQRANWERSKDMLNVKQSEFGQLAQRYGLSGAEQMYAAAQTQAVQARAAQLAAKHGLAENNEHYVGLMTALGARAAEREAAGLKYVLPSAAATKPQILDPEIGVPVSVDKYGDYRMDLLKEGAKVGATHAAKTEETSQKEASELAQRREQAGIPKGQEMISRAQKDLARAPELSWSKRVIVGSLTPQWMPEAIRDGVSTALNSKDERAREQSHTAVVNQYINDVTGAGGGPEEMRRIQRAAGSASSSEDRIKFYQGMRDWYRARDANLRAGTSSAGRKKFDEAMRIQKSGAAGITEMEVK